jgi:hypothetical protein
MIIFVIISIFNNTFTTVLVLYLIGILLMYKLGCLSTLIIFLSVLFLKNNLSLGIASNLKKEESLLKTF